MKNQLKEMILAAAAAAHGKGILPSSDFCEVVLEEPKADNHGDLSTNMAMQMAKSQRMAPRKWDHRAHGDRRAGLHQFFHPTVGLASGTGRYSRPGRPVWSL